MDTAHITSRPRYEVGDEVLGLCGKEFTVEMLWADVPMDHPICRDCVDYAVAALTEADHVIGFTRRRILHVSKAVERLAEGLTEERMVDLIHELDLDHQTRVKQKVTCICKWTSPEIFTENPECPIHGGTDEPREIVDVELPDDTPPTDAE